MKITSQEEYGIRLLLRIANHPRREGISIPQLSEAEGLSQHYVAKLCRILRLTGFINSSRGKEGGYTLALPASQISLSDVLAVLGGKLYSRHFCDHHRGMLKNCSRSHFCTVRSIWEEVQQAVDQVLDRFSLQDLMQLEAGNHPPTGLTREKSFSPDGKESNLVSKI